MKYLISGTRLHVYLLMAISSLTFFHGSLSSSDVKNLFGSLSSTDSKTTNGYSHDEKTQSRPEASSGGFSVMEFLLRVLAVMEFLLRVLAVSATLSAAIFMSKAKQTELVPAVVNSIPDIVNSLPLMVHVPAKYHYSPTFIYFVVANVGACGYTALSILASFSKRKKSSIMSIFLFAITVFQNADKI